MSAFRVDDEVFEYGVPTSESREHTRHQSRRLKAGILYSDKRHYLNLHIYYGSRENFLIPVDDSVEDVQERAVSILSKLFQERGAGDVALVVLEGYRSHAVHSGPTISFNSPYIRQEIKDAIYRHRLIMP